MSTLAQEIVEQLATLDEVQQREVLEFIKTLHKHDSLEDWFERVEQFQNQLQAKYGNDHVFNTQSLLDEVREESSWPRL